MPINHRFHETDFGNGFLTHNAILDKIPYEPEVLFVGTYNPDTAIEENGADFFYGRNYFWPALFNLFKGNLNLKSRRIPQRGGVPDVLNPALIEIKQICTEKKICFADFVKQTMHTNHPEYYLNENTVSYQNVCYNLIKDSDLAKLNKLNQVDWATNDIISFIRKHETIKTVYLTRQPTSVWKRPWSDVCKAEYERKVEFTPIYTPAARALAGNPLYKILLCHWLFNNHPPYGRLDHEWLKANGVPIEYFKNLCQTS